MKKNLIFGLFLTIILTGCTNNTFTPIDESTRAEENGLTIEQQFSQEISESNYISDFLKIFNSGTTTLEDNESIVSLINISGTFDENSSLSGNVNFSKETSKFVKGFENSEISFDLNIASENTEIEPLSTSGNLSLLYRDKGLYAMLHNFGIYMGEGNMTAKMYNLFSDLLIDKRIDLEIGNENSIVSVSEDEQTISQIIQSFTGMITPSNYENDEVISSISEILNSINSYSKLGIDTQGLTVISHDISYGEFGDGSINKTFSGHFSSINSDFDLGFTASKNGFEININNIHISDEENESSFHLSLQDNKKSNYTLLINSRKAGQETGKLNIQLKFNDNLEFQGNFILEPLEIISGQKISGYLNGNIQQKISSNKALPTLSGDIMLLHEIAEYI